MKILGIDPAFANMGLCFATTSNNITLDIQHMQLISTEGRDKKTVRKSSDDLRRAKELHTGLHEVLNSFSPQVVFAEVPQGSQTARASWGLGIAVGVLASIQTPFIQLSALEVKLATVGKKTASKEDMINWAITRYPKANWLRHGGRITNSNEHLADAIAVIHTGMQSDDYQRLLSVLKGVQAPLIITRKRVE